MTGVLLDLDALGSLDDATLSGFAERCRTAGFDGSLLARAESIAPARFDRLRLPLVHAWLESQDDHAATLALLFAYRGHVRTDALTAALGADLVGALRTCEVLVNDGAGLRSRMRLMPFEGLLLASDDADADANPVMGPGATTLELLGALPTRIDGRVLDVGCGAGSLALAAVARGASTAIGIDLDERAVALSRVNARINGIEATFRSGDLLAPVEGESFDLIVAQPPFVTQPPDVEATTYLHGGARGDELALRLLGQLPGALAPGGTAIVLMDTAGTATTSAASRVLGALGEAPLQRVLIAGKGHRADDQALGYASTTDSSLGDAFATAAKSYWRHLQAVGIERTTHAMVVLRRPHRGEPIFAVSVEPRPGRTYDADAIAQTFAGLALATLPPDALLDKAIALPQAARLIQHHPLGEGAEPGWGFSAPGSRAPDQELSEAAAMLLELIAAHGQVRAVVQAYAHNCNDAHAKVQAAVLDFVRKSLVSGLIVAAQT